jgi:lantibiotic modifying enzyme
VKKIGILDGTGGLVLFGFYYSRYFNDEKAYNWSYQKIEYILHNLKKDVKSTTLTSGLAGIAWLLKHLEINGFIDLGKDFSFKEIDDFLIRLMTHELKISNYDLLHGSLGTVLYFLSQGSSFTRPEVLSNFAITLYEKSIWDEKVCKWVNSGINYGSNGGQIGLAHGISSIIAILSKLYSRGIETDLVQEMIYGATKYLLKQKNNNPSFISLFPMLSTDEEDPTPSRLAWCYGDLGIGISLWRAGKELSDQRLKEQAIETFFHSTKEQI